MATSDVEILLVEDNPLDVELALYALSKNHLADHTQVARDGEEALDFVYGRGSYSRREPGQQPRLVLLDLKLPKVDGLEVLREMKSDPLLRAIPVVVMTTSKEQTDLTESYRLGVNSYIQKPLDFAQFCETVKQLGLYWLFLNVSLPSRAFAQSKSHRA